MGMFRSSLLSLTAFFLITHYAHLCEGLLSSSQSGPDPYDTLGIGKSASSQEIRRAYKQLAREWHPDKNPNPSASNHFVAITKAYELLSDPERRRLYDQRGIVDESYSSRPPTDFYTSNFNQFDPIDEILTFTTGGSFHYPYADGLAFLHKQSVTAKTFDQSTLPKSNTVPQLILFYGDWCTGCARAAPAWRTISDELQSVGMDVLCVHGERERAISRRMGISAVPAVVLLIEGQPHHYRDAVISPSKVIGFVRSKVPTESTEFIDSANVDTFLNSWSDNRVRVLIFGIGSAVRLRYSLLAFQYRERAAVGYVYPSEHNLRSKYGIQKAMDTILVFKEGPKPVASLAMSTIPLNLMKDLIENNKYLILPRLSSQIVMDAICPTESSVYRRRLCVLLLSSDSESDTDLRNELREYALKSESQPRLRYAYVYPERQKEFFTSLVNGGSKTSTQNLVILWRQDRKRVAFEWLTWDGTNGSIQSLESTLHKLLSEKQALSFQVEIKELTDEHAKSFMSKVFRKISVTMDFIRGHLTRDMIIQATSFVATVLFVIAGGFIMAYLVRLEEESIAAKASAAESRPPRGQTASSNATAGNSNGNRTSTRASGSSSLYHNSELKLHEMRGETYNGLVKLIKPGCRTIILLLDGDTKNSLLPKFQRSVWPYRKNKSLQFGFMHVDKGGGLSWYKQLLLLSLTEPRSLNINPRNCVGTVLCLNGYRRYFCVFHATLPAVGGMRRNRTSSNNGGYRNGGFLGFDSDGSSDEGNSDVESRRQEPPSDPHPNILFTSHLLDNLSNWLDRLFEGTTHRYHINYWPDFPVK